MTDERRTIPIDLDLETAPVIAAVLDAAADGYRMKTPPDLLLAGMLTYTAAQIRLAVDLETPPERGAFGQLP